MHMYICMYMLFTYAYGYYLHLVNRYRHLHTCIHITVSISGLKQSAVIIGTYMRTFIYLYVRVTRQLLHGNIVNNTQMCLHSACLPVWKHIFRLLICLCMYVPCIVVYRLRPKACKHVNIWLIRNGGFMAVLWIASGWQRECEIWHNNHISVKLKTKKNLYTSHLCMYVLVRSHEIFTSKNVYNEWSKYIRSEPLPKDVIKYNQGL